jgi:NAD(P)-dependent dehydrogenase (short-subunit alcohol dehydrogenase family)
MSENMNVKERTIIFTGGGGHLVSEMVRKLSALGANCVVTDLRLEKTIHLKEELAKKGLSIESMQLDVTRKESWEKLLAEAIKKYGRVDGLINGAGINSPSNFFDIDLEVFREIFNVNLMGTMCGCMVIGKHMVDNGRGSIINISSTSADPPLSKAFAYSASKAAVTNITKNIAREFGKTGVRVNALRPGFFPTNWNKKNFLTPERTKSIIDHTPMGRFGEPSELIGAVQWLLSDDSSFVTGSEIIVDGGFSAQTI